jgi:hypothetical protein
MITSNHKHLEAYYDFGVRTLFDRLSRTCCQLALITKEKSVEQYG